jgi:hypothetical protein
VSLKEFSSIKSKYTRAGNKINNHTYAENEMTSEIKYQIKNTCHWFLEKPQVKVIPRDLKSLTSQCFISNPGFDLIDLFSKTSN